jgi:hypothetical protein
MSEQEQGRFHTRLRMIPRIIGSVQRPRALTALLLVLLLLTIISGGAAQQLSLAARSEPEAPAFDSYSPQIRLPIISKTINNSPVSADGPIFGVNFISSAEDQVDGQQYLNGQATGASWNRWPLYWFNIETSQNVFDWSRQDNTVRQDLSYGFEIDAILLGTPLFYTTSKDETTDTDRPDKRGPYQLRAPQAAAPVGLYDPIFSDGTDTPGPGKSINPSNVWARFAYKAVNRYRPGGVLAQAHNWPSGVGITHWEIWNEPDLSWFWDSSTADYARLLKVGYLVVRQADPSATVLVGGLANFQKPTFYADVMDIFQSDPMSAPFDYFHDVLATHSYFDSWESWFHVYRATGTMDDHGVDKQIWLNESGVPAWNDYPGPVWDPTSSWRATMSEQADYVIQSAFFATFAGADAIFHFQLYDGCGNQPAGTDFPPHTGDLCDPDDPDVICAGDAFGLYSNPTDAACFTQHPFPESPRPYLTAFQLLTSSFTGVEPLWRQRIGDPDPFAAPQEWIAFYQSASNKRIVGMWSRVAEDQTAVIEATGNSGLVFWPDGSSRVVYPSGGNYTIHLPGAENNNDPDPNPLYPEIKAIGGEPRILIETDTTQPSVKADAKVQGTNIELSWSAEDGFGSGIENIEVYIAKDDGSFVPFDIQQAERSTTYPSEPGHRYTILIMVSDRAGNVNGLTRLIVDIP